MSIFVTPTAAPAPKTDNIRTVSIVLAVLFTGMAVAQLFTYETFPSVLTALWLPGGSSFAHIMAALVVIFEIFALPFLLFMRLSPAMRVLSMVSGWLVVAVWLTLSVWENVMVEIAGNSWLLGDTIHLPVGWWSVLWGIAVGMLVGWASWGMWPLKKHKHKK
jgi:hypothetical protein